MPGKQFKDLQLENALRLFSLVEAESKSQVEKWGIQEREVFEWLAYTTEEHGELSQAISEWYYRFDDPEKVLKEAIQEATLSLKIAEIFIQVIRLTKICRKNNSTGNDCAGCPASHEPLACILRDPQEDIIDLFDPLGN